MRSLLGSNISRTPFAYFIKPLSSSLKLFSSNSDVVINLPSAVTMVRDSIQSFVVPYLRVCGPAAFVPSIPPIEQ